MNSPLMNALETYWKRHKEMKRPPGDDVVARDVQELQWKHIRKIDTAISLKWLDPLVEGEAAEAEYVIDGQAHGLLVEPEIKMIEGVRKRRLREYQKHVEQIALMRWHTARGTPVTERDEYLVEPGFVAPTFEWEKVEEKRGPGRPAKVAA